MVVRCDERGISRGVELRLSGHTEDLLDIKDTYVDVLASRLLPPPVSPPPPPGSLTITPGSNPRNLSASYMSTIQDVG